MKIPPRNTSSGGIYRKKKKARGREKKGEMQFFRGRLNVEGPYIPIKKKPTIYMEGGGSWTASLRGGFTPEEFPPRGGRSSSWGEKKGGEMGELEKGLCKGEAFIRRGKK